MPIVADAEQRPGRQIPAATDLPSPAAARLKRPRWLSVRMVVGVLIVLVSVVTGVQVISAADRTVPVLVATEDLVPGQPLTSDLVELQNVRLERGVVDTYLTGEVGSGYVVVRPVGRGELLPGAAISPAAEVPEVRYVTLPLAASELPHGISAGDVVDVWLTPLDDGPAATLLLPAVSVTAASTGGGLTDASRQAQVTLAVTGDDLQEVTAQLVAAARAGRVYLAALPGVQ